MEDDQLKNWDALKPLILAKWSRLKSEDLKEVQPKVKDLVRLIRTKYRDELEQSILADLENLNLQVLKNP